MDLTFHNTHTESVRRKKKTRETITNCHFYIVEAELYEINVWIFFFWCETFSRTANKPLMYFKLFEAVCVSITSRLEN